MLIEEKIRAARGALGWSQTELAEATGISKSSIANIETGRVEPETRSVRKLESCFERNGVFFTPSGIEKRDIVLTTFKDYMDVLADIEATIAPGDEVLFHCADDSRSTPAISKKLVEMQASGYRFRSTICEGNLTVLGNIADYRWIPADYFADSQISVIYGDRYMQHVASRTDKTFVVMKSAVHADVMRRQFEYFWRNGKTVGGRHVSD